MTPLEFRRRFVAAQTADSRIDDFPGLREQLAEFVAYDATLLRKLGISEKHVAHRTEVGLPRQAAPFLAFTAYPEPQLDELYRTDAIPRSIFPLGGNGSGDPIGIEFATGAVVYLNHDRDMERVFINSSLQAFAEALCLYQEWLATRDTERFLSALGEVDAAALCEPAMWPSELR